MGSIADSDADLRVGDVTPALQARVEWQSGREVALGQTWQGHGLPVSSAAAGARDRQRAETVVHKH